jgi:hypothetical protein
MLRFLENTQERKTPENIHPCTHRRVFIKAMVRHVSFAAPHRGTAESNEGHFDVRYGDPPLTPQSNDSSTHDSDPYQRLLKSSFTNDDNHDTNNLEMRLHPKERMSVDEVLRQLKEFRVNNTTNNIECGDSIVSSLDEDRNDVEDYVRVRTTAPAASTPATKEAKARQLEMIKYSGALHDLRQDEYNGLDELISPISITTEPNNESSSTLEAGNGTQVRSRSIMSNIKQKGKEIADYGNGDWSGKVKDCNYIQGHDNQTVPPPVKKKTNIFQRWGKGLVEYERNMASKGVEQNDKVNDVSNALAIGRVSDENTAPVDANVRKNKLTSIFGQSSRRLGIQRLGKINDDTYVKIDDTNNSNIDATTSDECKKKKVVHKSKGKSRVKYNEKMNSIPYSSIKGFNSFHHEANAALAAAGVAVSNKDVGIQKAAIVKTEISKNSGSPKLYIIEQGSSESIFEFHEKEDGDDDSNIGLVNGISEDTTSNPINNDESSSYQDYIPKTTSMRSRHWPRPAATIPITISGRFHKEADAALSAALAAEEMRKNKEALVVAAADSRPREIVGVESVNESSIDHDDDDDDYDDEYNDEFFGNRDISTELRTDCEADVTVEEEIFTTGSEDTLIQDMYTEPSIRTLQSPPTAPEATPSPPPPAQPPKLDPVQLIMPYLQQMYRYPPPPAYQYPPPPPTQYVHTSGWTATYHYPPPMQYQYNHYGSYDPTPQTGAYYTVNIPGA